VVLVLGFGRGPAESELEIFSVATKSEVEFEKKVSGVGPPTEVGVEKVLSS
jgi:hypothetical protein